MTTERTGYPVIDEILESIAPPSTQPVPDTGGEWSLSSEVVNGIIRRDRISGPLTCIDIPKHYGAIAVFARPEVAEQIVSDHRAIPLLVAALKECQSYVELHTPEKRGLCGSLLDTIDAALAAVGREER